MGPPNVGVLCRTPWGNSSGLQEWSRFWAWSSSSPHTTGINFRPYQQRAHQSLLLKAHRFANSCRPHPHCRMLLCALDLHSMPACNNASLEQEWRPGSPCPEQHQSLPAAASSHHAARSTISIWNKIMHVPLARVGREGAKRANNRRGRPGAVRPREGVRGCVEKACG